MRIGVVCNSFARSGGMEKYALNVVEALIRLGHHHVIFCKKEDKLLPFYDQCEVHVCPKKWMPNKLHVVYFNHWLKKIRQRVPVEFAIGCCMGASSEIMVCGGTHIGYLKAMRRKPTFYDRWTINIEWEQYQKCRFVVAHAKAMDRELQQFYGLPADKIRVIYPPQTFKCLDAPMDKMALRKKYNLPLDKTLFLFPSMSHKRKGFALLKEYFKTTPYDECLIVAGKPIDGEYKNIQYVGFVNEMQEMYQACDYSVLASFYDPLGTVGMESVWNGTPTLIAETIGSCECVDPEALRSFNAWSLNSFKKVMDEVRVAPMKITPPYQRYVHVPLDLTIDEHVKELIKFVAL